LSRNQAWMYMLKALHSYTAAPGTGDTVYRMPDTFQPACTKNSNGEVQYQVICFTVDGFPHIGVVEEVFRGALVQPSKKAAASLSLLVNLKPFCIPKQLQQIAIS